MHRAAALLVFVLLAACGPDDPTPTPAPTAAVPGTPEEALAWVRDVAADPVALRERLARWPTEDEDFTFTTETQVALTWRLRLALEDRRIDDAARDHEALVRDYEGEGESPEGTTFDAVTMRLGLFDGALIAARDAVERPRPDEERARAILEQALRWHSQLNHDGRAEHVDLERWQHTRDWIQASTAREIFTQLGLDDNVVATLTGPAALLVLDDFALGQMPVTAVLERWMREGLTVHVVPVLRGQVRVGQRLVPADSDAHERESLTAHAQEIGLTLQDTALRTAQLEALGFGPQDVLILIYDAEGRILARKAGITPALKPLEPVVQRILSR